MYSKSQKKAEYSQRKHIKQLSWVYCATNTAGFLSQRPLSTSTEKPGESVKLFSKLDHLATQNISCNVFQRWVKSC